MEERPKNIIRLILKTDLAFLPVVTSFVERASLAFGIGEAEALALTLASEEIFVYICSTAAPEKLLEMSCSSRGYYVDQEFFFEPQKFDIKVFNITSSIDLEDHIPDETGLLIASRMVDRFQCRQEDESIRLILTKEKSYPEISFEEISPAKPCAELTIREPNSDELKLLVYLINKYYEPGFIPLNFKYPGKVADMQAAGEYHCSIAADEAGNIGGGIIRRWDGRRLIEFYGPYVFDRPGSETATALVDDCIASTARTRAMGLITRRPTPDLPVHYFEKLGSFTFKDPFTEIEITPLYRHLEEDAGLAVWAHPSIEPFMREWYKNLYFAREIRLVKDEGESIFPSSVLFTEFDRSAHQATLHPVWFGKDADEVLAAHVQTLVREGLPNIFFEMDVAEPWQCRFAPALLGNGFKPKAIRPYAAKADLVIFQHE